MGCPGNSPIPVESTGTEAVYKSKLREIAVILHWPGSNIPGHVRDNRQNPCIHLALPMIVQNLGRYVAKSALLVITCRMF